MSVRAKECERKTRYIIVQTGSLQHRAINLIYSSIRECIIQTVEPWWFINPAVHEEPTFLLQNISFTSASIQILFLPRMIPEYVFGNTHYKILLDLMYRHTV